MSVQKNRDPSQRLHRLPPWELRHDLDDVEGGAALARQGDARSRSTATPVA
jgi:hypothetical protein